IFGGNGFILQKLSGTCTAFVELGGEIVTYDLAAGESIQVHPGHVGMFESTVNFDITFMRGITNALFGGDGLFIARLTGPGKVWLQTLTMPNLAHALLPYMGQQEAQTAAQSGIAGGIAGGVAGSVLRGIFGGD
ncbi:MAG TPA: AIM24 family protein, partial [Candidatus Aquilonibacter sp.]|nr:AIM24 family protein [Candidatus Aquilonibacter sp.]